MSDKIKKIKRRIITIWLVWLIFIVIIRSNFSSAILILAIASWILAIYTAIELIKIYRLKKVSK